MNGHILEKLQAITPEEQAILNGRDRVDWRVHMQKRGSVINAKKLLADGAPTRINTIRDCEFKELAEAFGVAYRKDFLN